MSAPKWGGTTPQQDASTVPAAIPRLKFVFIDKRLEGFPLINCAAKQYRANPNANQTDTPKRTKLGHCPAANANANASANAAGMMPVWLHRPDADDDDPRMGGLSNADQHVGPGIAIRHARPSRHDRPFHASLHARCVQRDGCGASIPRSAKALRPTGPAR